MCLYIGHHSLIDVGASVCRNEKRASLILNSVKIMANKSHKGINFQPISKAEKAQLKRRITGSVLRHIYRRRFLKYGTVVGIAILSIFVSVALFRTPDSQLPSIESFAKTVEEMEVGDNVQLVLSKSRQIEIAEEHSAISYSSSGEQVQIGATHTVNQQTTQADALVYNTLIVPFGKRSEILLSDGTKVWLNSGSKLIFPAQFETTKREVYLEGEAVFDVIRQEGQPFVVKSEYQDIKVLGTVFNVSNYKDDTQVYTVLQSGSLLVSLSNAKKMTAQKSIRLSPGTLATLNKQEQSIQAETVVTEPYFSWRDGIFIFKNDPLSTIMKKISRYYNVEIRINNEKLAKETFSGHLDVKENIEHVMQTLKETSGFDYEMTQDNRLIIN